MIVCIKHPNGMELYEIQGVDVDDVKGTVTFKGDGWANKEIVHTKNKPDQTVIVFDGGEPIMRVNEKGAKMLKGNVVITQGAD